jgi:hypothetical protein
MKWINEHGGGQYRLMRGVHAKYEFKSYHFATLMSILSNQYIKILATPLQYNRKE